MINGDRAKRIKKELNAILPNVSLDYAHAKTGLSAEGIRKAASVTNQFRPATAKKLAKFIEEESGGEILAKDLLGPKKKNYVGANLRGANFSGEDLSGVDFTHANLDGANLSGTNLGRTCFLGATARHANLAGAMMRGTDARCVVLDGANIEGVRIEKCRFHGANLKNTNIHHTYVHDSWFTGADLTDANFRQVTWYTWGSVCRGIIFPDFDPKELSRCYQCNEAVAHLLMREYPDDFEIRQICEFINSRMFFRCWDDFAERILNHHESRISDLERAFAKHPDWLLYDRWKLALFMRDFVDVSQYRGLRETPFYNVFKKMIDQTITTKEKELDK